jgi:RNA polymerase sigma factor (sigma-70 family)
MVPAAERFKKIYEEYYETIWKHVQRKASDLDVEGIVTDAFITLWTRIDHVPNDKAKQWLLKVADHKIGNAIRAKQARPQTVAQFEDIGVENAHTSDDHAAHIVDEMTFDEALNKQEDILDRKILRLIGIYDYKPGEIAKALNLKRSMISMRMQRLRGKLATLRPDVPAPRKPDDEPKTPSAEGRTP